MHNLYKLVNNYSILVIVLEDVIGVFNDFPSDKLFILDDDSSNEVYSALNLYMKEKYPIMFRPIGSMRSFVRDFVKMVINYYESQFGLDFTGKYSIHFVNGGGGVYGNYTYPYATIDNIKVVKVPVDRFKEFSSIVRKLDVENGVARVVMSRSNKFEVVLNASVPFYRAVNNIIHEFGHVYTLNQLYTSNIIAQSLELMSTSEFLAVVLNLMFLQDYNLLFGFTDSDYMSHYEYYTYLIDFLNDRRRMVGTVKNILEDGMIFDNEIMREYKFYQNVKFMKFFHHLYVMTVLRGSFMRPVKLEELFETDYLFVYYLFNLDKFRERFKRVSEYLEKAEKGLSVYFPELGEVSLPDLMEDFVSKINGSLVKYDASSNSVIELIPLEYYYLKNYFKDDDFFIRP